MTAPGNTPRSEASGPPPLRLVVLVPPVASAARGRFALGLATASAIVAALAGLLFASHTSSPRRIAWAGDAETGNLSQWASADRVAPDRIRVVTSPVRQGRYAYRFEVRHGDDPVPAFSPNDRAELGQGDPGHGPAIRAGMQQWYGFSALFPKGFPDASWQVFAQWKQNGPNPPPGGMSANDNVISFDMGGAGKGLRGHGGILFRTPLRHGVWNDFVVHVKWSPDPRVGWVSFWYDGRQVVPRTHTADMYRDSSGRVIPNYARVGYYRSRSIMKSGVVYIDAYKVGYSYAAVAP